jgi:putative ABC transport system substrate-binding protein
VIDRRAFISGATLALLAAPVVAEAQEAGKVWRIGYLSPSAPTPEDGLQLLAALRQGLVEMGYVEGRNIAIESRFASGRFEQLPDLATQLVSRKVDVIVG